MSEVSESLRNARAALLSERNPAAHWTGELSTSAFSTATALVALGSVDPERYSGEVVKAAKWLLEPEST